MTAAAVGPYFDGPYRPVRNDGPVAVAVRDWLAAAHVPPDAPLVVACSGGADSLALAAAVRSVTATRAPGRAVPGGAVSGGAVFGDAVPGDAVSGGAVFGDAVPGDAAPRRAVSAATVDHGLQPGSAAVARSVAELLRAVGYQRVDVLPVRVRGPGGLEAAARRARYAALAELAASIGPDAAVLLAHTADDQAETVLLGLSRGSGPRSIAGMRPWRPPWARPLLSVRRADTEEACAGAGLVPWRDPHNLDPAYTRVRLRREVLPLLGEVLGGDAAPALARTAKLMAADLAALDVVAERALTGALDSAGNLRLESLADQPLAIRTRMLRAWVRTRTQVTALTYQHLVRLADLVTAARPGSAVRLPGGTDVVRQSGVLTLRTEPRHEPSS